jgi:hypothetical protein
MTRGQTTKGRARASRMAAVPPSRPLLKGYDHGEPIAIQARDVGATGDRWVEPFLAANMPGLRRLAMHHEVRADPVLRVLLRPGPRIGAIPLLSPATRKVTAGLLLEPRFRWAALGAVFNAIGFSVEPDLGGAPLVPGSAREVPPWLLAGPVIERIAALLRHRRRGFVERAENRASPRGRVDWTSWATGQVPRGAWTTFPCRFSEPDDDPDLIASIRWTLSRLEEELSTVAASPPGRHLLRLAAELQSQVGPGASRRPSSSLLTRAGSSDWIAAAVEAMTWVVEERGLGGARSLDGLAWDLSIDAVWEAWVAAFAAELGRHLGMITSPFQAARRPLRWDGPARSMGALMPDVELRGAERVVWVDAKYKAHLELLSRRGWTGLGDEVRGEHRADLHQALAYASLADAPQVDTLLVYPQLGGQDPSPATVATVTSGRRRVRLVLASLPFGYRNPEHRERCLRSFRELLAA